MSGGSYNYLYCLSDTGNFTESKPELINMLKRLEKIPHANGVQLISQQIIKKINEYEQEIKTRQTEIKQEIYKVENVWRAIELYDSNDNDYETITEAINDFNSRSETS